MTIVYDMVSNEFVEPQDESIEVEARQSCCDRTELPQLQLQEVQIAATASSKLPADLAFQTFLKNSS